MGNTGFLFCQLSYKKWRQYIYLKQGQIAISPPNITFILWNKIFIYLTREISLYLKIVLIKSQWILLFLYNLRSQIFQQQQQKNWSENEGTGGGTDPMRKSYSQEVEARTTVVTCENGLGQCNLRWCGGKKYLCGKHTQCHWELNQDREHQSTHFTRGFSSPGIKWNMNYNYKKLYIYHRHDFF